MRVVFFSFLMEILFLLLIVIKFILDKELLNEENVEMRVLFVVCMIVLLWFFMIVCSIFRVVSFLSLLENKVLLLLFIRLLLFFVLFLILFV